MLLLYSLILIKYDYLLYIHQLLVNNNYYGEIHVLLQSSLKMMKCIYVFFYMQNPNYDTALKFNNKINFTQLRNQNYILKV